MEGPAAVSAHWRTSSYSSNGGSSCVEAGHFRGSVLVRDTTQGGHGPVLRVTPAAWTRLTTAIRTDAALS